MAGNKKKKVSFMQRLSSWFEQLPLRRRGSNRRSELQGPKKQQSKSAAPRLLRYSVSAVQSCRHRDHSLDVLPQSLINQDQPHVNVPASWNRQETVTRPCQSLSKSLSTATRFGRKNIRTNPWVSRDRPSVRTIIYSSKPPNDLLYASMDRSASIRVESLDESTCSSGYGSQDSSPESSVHSPEWQPSDATNKTNSLEDKAVECNSVDVDEALGLDLADDDDSDDYKPIGDKPDKDGHIYYELEAFNRLSQLLDDRVCSSDSEFASSSADSQRSSPVYAQPYSDHTKDLDSELSEYPNLSSSFTYIPCNSCKPAPQFHPPPPPPNDFEQAELDFLAELDAQIAELQMKSVAVRQLVDQARERRDVRHRNAELYLELAELRRMKWVLHNHFELVL